MMSYEPPVVVTLHRYFIWSNRMRKHFEDVLNTGVLEKNLPWYEPQMIEMFLYMSYWYAGLYVVIEGWNELKLSDPEIDSLLASSNVDLLRRYRNGAFHFQKTYFDPRFTDFMHPHDKTVEWIRSLTSAFSRYFLNWFATHDTDGNLKPAANAPTP